MKVEVISEMLKSLSSIFTVFKPRPEIVEEKAERRDIKNKTRAKRHELKRIKLQKKIDRKSK